MKRIILFFTVLYCLRSDGSLATYEGMSQQVVTDMLVGQNLTCQWLTKSQYDISVASATPHFQ